MSITYEEWCKTNTNIIPLVRSLHSSLPEQYIGFYLHEVFGDEVEYQKQFDWLGRRSLDIYIPSLQLAVEYDGEYYHRNTSSSDSQKTSLCHAHGIYLIHIQEMKATQDKSRKRNVVSYYYEKNYKNIDVAIQSLCVLINKKYGTTIQIDVDLNRDDKEIISYVQVQYHKRTIAYIWPESEDYWLEEENQQSIYDVFYTDNIPFSLQCPYCQSRFTLFTRYFHHRKSLVPCECEYDEIERALKATIRKYKETGELIIFDDSLSSRRLYDRMVQSIRYYLDAASKEEIEMYKKLGFESPRLDYYLTRF
ncbi:MAG: hypothetical protein E7283_06055 [Lachnospiraceae bacterium]|nr:hypothetical protein [Lachnospiraceae bacterium]